MSDYEFIRRIKENTKKVLVLLMILSGGVLSAQSDTLTHRGELKVVMPISFAKNIEFWGQKGIISVPLIESYQNRMVILETKLSFQEMIYNNCQSAQDEYRTMVTNAATHSIKLQQDLAEVTLDRDKWKHKARNRGNILGLGAVVVGLLAYIQIAN